MQEGSWTAPDDAADYTVLLVFETMVLDRFLLARHRERGWELPGGRVEAGEGLDAAARREWGEETGLGLARLEPLLLHHRPDGSRGHIFLGALDGPSGTGRKAVGQDRVEEGEKIVEVRSVRRLSEVAPLAFPDDPYAAVAAAVWERAGQNEWQRVGGEGLDTFIARLARHPEAHPLDHHVVPHPATR